MKKLIFLAGSNAPQPTSSFSDIITWTAKMRQMFRRGLAERETHEENIKVAAKLSNENKDIPVFDEKTLGGCVDFDKFAEILDTPV